MKFKRIQECEARKLVQMIKSNDREMHELAAAIINIQEGWRFSMNTILVFLTIGSLITMTGIVWAGYHGAGWYLLPLIVAFILQVILSIAYMVGTAEERKGYDKTAEWITDN